jgi:beta-glucuronidase
MKGDFRTVSVKNGRILLNNKPIFIKGFNRHEDFAFAGCAIPPQLAAIDIDLMRSMNANAVRTCHYPNDERFLDMCDEQGILVWEENHARGLTIEQMLNPNFEKQCEDCITEMITSHRNHPSIIIWGILNECASDVPEGRRMYEKQFAQIKSMDSSRPVTFAMNKHFRDICLDLVDIVSFNVYFGWYYEHKTQEEMRQAYLKELEWINSTEGKGKPIIISEFGAGAIYGYRNPSRCKWSEERQLDILKNTLSIYLNRPEICGVYIWQFADCRVTDEIWGIKRPRTMNNKGIVDEYRRPKLAYSVVKEYYGNKKQ